MAGGLVLLAAGYAVLGIGFRPRQGMANVAPSSVEVTASSLLASSQPAAAQASAEAQVKARSVLSGLPLIFEPNQGQTNLDSADPSPDSWPKARDTVSCSVPRVRR